MRFFYFIILIIILIRPLSYADSGKGALRNDSILELIRTCKDEYKKAQYYLNLTSQNLNTNAYLSKFFATKALDIYDKLNDESGRGYAYVNIAAASRLIGDVKTDIEYLKRARKQIEKTKNKYLEATWLHEMALSSLNQNDLEKALEYNLSCLKIREDLKQVQELAAVYNNVGIIYAQMGDWDKALEYFKKALNNETQHGNQQSIANEINNIGIYFIIKGQLDTAYRYLVDSKNMRKKIRDFLGLAGSYNNLALWHYEKNQFEKAIAYADSGYKIADDINSKKEKLEILDTYYKIYEKKKDFKKALEYFQEEISLRKKLDQETNSRKLSEIQSSVELEKKENELEQKNLLLEKAEAEEKKRNLQITFLLFGVLTLSFVTFYIFKTNKKIKSANAIISSQKQQVEIQKEIIEEKHKDITDSINYAQKIQHALLLSEDLLNSKLGSCFIINHPRDIVSGDFYWFSEKNGNKILAVADCTGHGVPGAFMSMIGITLLNQIVNEKGIVSPSEILNELRNGIISALNQTSDKQEKRDGMDIAIISLKEKTLTFSGANNPCLILKNSGIEILKPNKQPVGLFENQMPFTEQSLKLEPGDEIYLFSDGIIDQFGGADGKKLKMKGWSNWLEGTRGKSSTEKKQELELLLSQWKGKTNQTDDILVIGITC